METEKDIEAKQKLYEKGVRKMAKQGALPNARFYDARQGPFRTGRKKMSKKQRRVC